MICDRLLDFIMSIPYIIGYTNTQIRILSNNNMIAAEKITTNQSCMYKLERSVPGTWLVRISSRNQYLTSKNYTLYGIDDHEITSLLTISLKKKNKIINYRFLQLIDIKTYEVSYVIPNSKYNIVDDKIINMKFNVIPYDIIIDSLNHQPNMVYLNWIDFISSNFDLSIYNELPSSNSIQLLENTYSTYISKK